MRTVKVAAAILATVGLVILWFAATRSQVPLIQAGQAGSTMNMAYVRVEGHVVRSPTYYSESGYLSFTVDDGTGEVRISAYQSETDALRAAGRIPALGDWVSVAGTLRVREDSAAITLNVPEHLEIQRPESVERQIGSVTAADHMQRVRIRGQVWEVREPYEGLILLTLRDASGAIDVAIDQSLEALTGEFLPVEAGQSVEVVGAVGLYGETPQIVPASVMDVVLLPEAVEVAPTASIGMLTTADNARMVTVGGTVAGFEFFSAGVKFTLDDGSGALTVLLWQDIYDALAEPAALSAGATVRVAGEVSVYRGEIEVIPQRAVDVQVLQAGSENGGEAPPDAAPVRIGELDSDQVGQAVTVEGIVVDVASFSSGFKFTLDDGSGQVALLLWLSTYDELADPSGLNLGAQVQASGEVDEYAGELQVVPASGAAVTVLTPGRADTALQDIGALTAGDADQLVTVEGLVTRAESFAGGYRVWIDDGSGAVMILLWDNVYQRVAGREGLIAGAQVHVTGLVEEYEGALEIVPQLPVDLIVGER